VKSIEEQYVKRRTEKLVEYEKMIEGFPKKI
jgi:hypothetical protein